MQELEIPANLLDRRKAAILEKLEDNMFEGNHPNGIFKGYTKEGFFMDFPKIGDSFFIGAMGTTEVTKIVKKEDDFIVFDTKNSTYKLTLL